MSFLPRSNRFRGRYLGEDRVQGSLVSPEIQSLSTPAACSSLLSEHAFGGMGSHLESLKTRSLAKKDEWANAWRLRCQRLSSWFAYVCRGTFQGLFTGAGEHVDTGPLPEILVTSTY